MMISIVSFPMNMIFQVTISYPYWMYLSNFLWVGLIVIIIFNYRKEVKSYFKFT